MADYMSGLPKEGEKTDMSYDDKMGDMKDVDVRPAMMGDSGDALDVGEVDVDKTDLQLTGEDLLEVEQKMGTMSIERCRAIMIQVRTLHKHDQNFPTAALDKMNVFLDDPDVAAHPGDYAELVREMKIEALLVTENSPYAEVRAVVDNTDDPSTPSFTFRVWVIGIFLSAAGAFINQLFSIRQPLVYVTANVAQLIAYPLGKGMAKVVPDVRFNLLGQQHSLNPGKFNAKEHMLITIMATVAYNTPYTGYTVFVAALPMFFDQPYAYNFGFQILNSLGSNFVGFGMAGLARRFLVYPSFCVWPGALVTIALNKAFHSETNEPVKGPFNRTYTWSREKFFLIAFVSMFAYWFFPGFIFQAMSMFNWISWIAPNNMVLNNIVGGVNGLGLNPWPTFDFNLLTAQGWVPLVIPTFSILNMFFGMSIGFFMIIAFYWTNAWDTAYLPINDNHTWDNTGSRYNVTRVLNDDAMFDLEKYQDYSMPYMAAGNLTIYFWFFAIYTCTLSYAFLYHRHEIALGFKGLWRSMRRNRHAEEDEEDLAVDIHQKLMRAYREVPEWWYLITLVLAMICGMVGYGAWPSHTSPVTVLFGVIMAAISIIPVGLVTAVTGIQVTMNVLAEFIGGAMVAGNALEMNAFKMYGYISTAQAVYFSNDLKLAHYVKIAPRHTFAAQMIATFISTLVCTGLFNFQLARPNVCTAAASFGFSCPGEATFFTASVFWGTLSPTRLFGPGRRFNTLLIGFPVGLLMPFFFLGLQKMFPRQRWMRQIHPVMICAGGLLWAPYNFAYFWPIVPLTCFSWLYIKKRYLAFWSKYQYVLAAAWMAGIAISAIVIFFALEIPDVSIDWWGNTVSYTGCEAEACTRLPIPDIGYFGPEPGTNSFT